MWYTATLSSALGHSAGIFFTDKLMHMQLDRPIYFHKTHTKIQTQAHKNALATFLALLVGAGIPLVLLNYIFFALNIL